MDKFLYSNCSLPNVLDLLRLRFKRRNPDAFPVSGMTCFCGVQGSGKTLSAVLYVHKLMTMYPRLRVVSNIGLNFYPDRIIPYEGVEQLKSYRNGIYGVVFLLDEIQLEFNSLESKNVPLQIFEVVCQQRKQRVHIVGTSQVFGRLAKPFREQFRTVVLCKNISGLLFLQSQFRVDNVAEDDDVSVKLCPDLTTFYFPCPSDFDMYDTYDVVRRLGR